MAWDNRIRLWAIVVLGTIVPARLLAEPEPLDVSGLDLSQKAATATVERICETAVRNIARRYNLNNEQTEFTNELMKREVNKFLKEHEEQVWPVIRELLARQFKPPESTEDLKRVGKVARGLARLAKEAIFRANAEWRRTLTEEQKQMHDFDLAEMEKTFGQIDKNFGDWEEGRRTDQPIFPAPQVAETSPPTPTKPKDGTLPKPKVQTFEVTIFDTFVEEFIKDYGLDAAQIEAARSILKEFKAKANDFKNAKKAEFAKVETDRNKALADADFKKAAKADTARKKLLEPVYQLFARMESRLKNLLTTKQLEDYPIQSKTAEAKKQTTIRKKTTPKKKARATTAAAKGKSEKTKASTRKEKG